MGRKTRLIAISVLFIYCSLFLLANSPLHLYLFHRNGNNPEAFDLSITSSLAKSKNNQACPLCKFLSLILFRGMPAIYFLLMAFCYIITAVRYKTVPISTLYSYYTLAPPHSFS